MRTVSIPSANHLDLRFHHQFGKAARGQIKHMYGIANGRHVIALLNHDEAVACGCNRGLFFTLQLLPRWALPHLSISNERKQNLDWYTPENMSGRGSK